MLTINALTNNFRMPCGLTSFAELMPFARDLANCLSLTMLIVCAASALVVPVRTDSVLARIVAEFVLLKLFVHFAAVDDQFHGFLETCVEPTILAAVPCLLRFVAPAFLGPAAFWTLTVIALFLEVEISGTVHVLYARAQRTVRVEDAPGSYFLIALGITMLVLCAYVAEVDRSARITELELHAVRIELARRERAAAMEQREVLQRQIEELGSIYELEADAALEDQRARAAENSIEELELQAAEYEERLWQERLDVLEESQVARTASAQQEPSTHASGNTKPAKTEGDNKETPGLLPR
eukprot:m51a1_g9007 hypothetical protein (298) ;mRNA; f:134149-135282